MSTKLEIYNQALIKCGAEILPVITTVTKGQRLLNEIYDAKRKEELMSHNWKFAKKRASLTKEVTAGTFKFTNVFAFPTDFLKLLEIPSAGPVETYPYQYGQNSLFEEEGNKIYTNLGSPLEILYVADKTEADMPEIFANVLACRLAYEINESLNQSDSKTQLKYQEYLAALQKAKKTNAIGSPARSCGAGVLERERL